MSSSAYYIPKPSHWPIVGCVALLLITMGGGHWLHQDTYGMYMFFVGMAILIFMMYGWFKTVIDENRSGKLANKQVDLSFRWGMCWFIFSEVMFFAAFFGALFYSRFYSVPWLGGIGHKTMTHVLLWPSFKAQWPLLHNPNPGIYHGAHSVMETWDIPAINTLILLTSGVTITIAHYGVLANRRWQMLGGQLATVLLGIIFLGMQAHEYSIAYLDKGLKLSAGIYGTTFFMLTGFHAMHVTIGTICLIVIFYRMLKKDFHAKNHFAFEAVAWYWHFVDVVWLFLFIFVYWI